MANNGFRQANERGPVPLQPRAHMLSYCAALAFTAGFVKAVVLLVLAVPVGNLTGVTTQLGMTLPTRGDMKAMCSQ
jgi:hypothetical protein